MRRPTRRASNRAWLGGAAIIAAAAVTLHAQPSEDDVARAIVVGQVYRSGEILVAGFIDDPSRAWPARINMTGLFEPRSQYIGGDLLGAPTDEDLARLTAGDPNVDRDPQREIFSTIDRMDIVDRPLALYKSHFPNPSPLAVVGWETDFAIEDVSYQQRRQTRPLTAAERAQVQKERASQPKDVECTTVPRYLDAAGILLTARAPGNRTIRLSSYETPGCLGHLATIYVLDVITPRREPRRYVFSHYTGLL